MPRNATISRDQVLDVAGRLFYKQGVRATGVAQVSAEANCGKQALYRLFPTKDDLVAAHLERVVDARVASAARAMAAAGDDPAEQLVALTEDVSAWAGHRGYRGCAMRNYLREFPKESTAAKRVAVKYLATTRRCVETLAAQARPDDGLVGDMVWLVHEGLYNTTRVNSVDVAAGARIVRQLVTRPAM